MKRIEEYVNFICKNSRGSKAEINDLKQEMRSHLLQTVQEFQEEGKSEQESIELAITRFGEKHQVQDELARVYRTQKRFGQVILAVAAIFLVLGICSMVFEQVTNANLRQTMNILDFESETITSVAKTNNLDLLDKTVKKLFAEPKKNQIAYVALEKLPDDLDINNPPPVQPISLGKIIYKYPSDLQSVREFGNNSNGEFFMLRNTKMYLEIGMKQYSNSNRYYLFKPIGVGFCMIYWMLFGIWATINAYHLNKLNIGWVIVFFAFNLLGYLLFIIDERLRLFKKVKLV